MRGRGAGGIISRVPAGRLAPRPRPPGRAGARGGGRGPAAAAAAAAPGPPVAAGELGLPQGLPAGLALGRLLGAGGYGRVYAASEAGGSGAGRAVKAVPKSLGRRATVPPEIYLRKVAAEAALHAEAAAASPAVCPLHAAYEDDQAMYLVLELCDGGGSLLQAPWLRGGSVSERAVARAARSVLESIAACHALGIVFRDVKPENFLLCADGRVVLSDFGQAARLPEDGGTLSERCGTLPYLAPEVVRRSYGQEADCWSCGVVLYQLLSGRLPFTDEEGGPDGRPTFKGMARAILYQPLDLESPPWHNVSVAAKHLVRQLLERDPRRRISAAEALEHYWVREGGVAPSAPLGAANRGALVRYAAAGALRQALLRQTAALAPDDAPEVLALRRVFDALDADGTGCVRVADLAAVLSGLEGEEAGARTGGGGSCLQGDLLRRSFRGQEALVFSEFVAAFADWTVLQGGGRVEEWSERALAESGGSVEPGDLAAAVCGSADGGEAEECEADFNTAFQEADRDSDGRLGLREWLAALRDPPE